MNVRDRNFDSEFYFKSSRSGGKGGQNVNKVETKIELNIDIRNSNSLSDSEKERILEKLKNKIDKDGVLKIVSQTERSQLLNKNIAVKKFYDLIEKALKKEKIRKKIILSAAEKKKRLDKKKKLSVKKISRKVKDSDYD